MKVALLVLAVILPATFSKDSQDGPQVYKRLVPADEVKEHPGKCYASTKKVAVDPGNSWELSPYCGRSTCTLSKDKPPRLLELVEDCGPSPLNNPKCTLQADSKARFPGCCPIFKCEDGAVLEYPKEE